MVKVFFECVACVCLTIGTIFLVIVLFRADGFLMSVMTISFAITNWYIQVSVELRKCLFYKHFILKDTKLLV